MEFNVEPTFRKSMSWLHTWAGVVVGSLLFVIFWMGTLSVFDREIDRWMMPDTRLAPAPPFSLDQIIKPIAEELAGNSPQWTINLPTDRTPTIILAYRDGNGKDVRRHIDPHTGKLIQEQGTHGGSRFIFPFHYSLHIKWKNIGYWLVGLAGMSMLVLLVSGIVIHKRIFQDFFIFRPKKHVQRASLDLHNLTGILALPFHFVVALSGLFIFFSIYFPWSVTAAYQGNKEAMTADVYGTYTREKANRPGELSSLDAMVNDAQARWSARLGEGAKADFVRIVHPADAAGFVQVRRIFPEHLVTMDSEGIVYNATDGTILKEHYSAPVRSIHAFFSGLHFVQFKHWTLRWLYFLAGLSGCVMIATGFFFWLEARRIRHVKKGLSGVRVVECLTVGSVTGIMIATLAFFIANKLLPLDAKLAGVDRAGLEMWIFYLVWLATFGHAWLRSTQAWCDQAWMIAGMALLALALNWLTTSAYIAQVLETDKVTGAGMDAILLFFSILAVIAARRLRKQKTQKSATILTTSSSMQPRGISSPSGQTAPVTWEEKHD
jgi:uncharacterized iron-regulated membrane protein